MSSPKIFVAFAICLTFFSFNGAALSQSQMPSPQAIVERMAARYASISSYQDNGVVETVSGGSLPMRATDIFFKTYFTRPQKLRFEWLDYRSPSRPYRNVVWSDGTKTFCFYSFDPQVETKESLSLGLAGATGISRGSAHTVPVLLVKEVSGFSLTQLSKLSLKGQEQFEEEDCYIVEGYHPNGEAWQLWIGKNDFLLHKLRTKQINGDFEEEIHRDMKVDANIAEETYHPKIAEGRVASVISKEKEEDTRRLLEITSPKDRLNRLLNDVVDLLKDAMPQVPEKVWQEVLTEIHLNSDMLIQLYVEMYDSHYTHDEIKQLLAFYESPLGKKMARASTLIVIETTQRGEGIGRELVKRIGEKLRAKGYKVPIT